jgi:hypothetical protein
MALAAETSFLREAKISLHPFFAKCFYLIFSRSRPQAITKTNTASSSFNILPGKEGYLNGTGLILYSAWRINKLYESRI